MSIDMKCVADYERRLGERAESLERSYRRIAELEAELAAIRERVGKVVGEEISTQADTLEQIEAIAAVANGEVTVVSKAEAWLAKLEREAKQRQCVVVAFDEDEPPEKRFAVYPLHNWQRGEEGEGPTLPDAIDAIKEAKND